MKNMPPSTAAPLGVTRAAGRTIIRGIERLVRAVRNRQDAAMLAGFDERMLADIGLNRSDLRDAFAEPLWRDPTAILVDRACERRTNRLPVTFTASGRVTAPSIVPAQRCGSSACAA